MVLYHAPMRSLPGGHPQSGALRLWLLTVALAITACGTPPKEEAPEPLEPAEQGPQSEAATSPDPGVAEEADRSTLDDVQETVSDRVRKTAVWLDSFLGDERAMAEQNRTTVTLRLDTFVEEREGVDFNLRVNARVVLPQTQDRFHLVLAGYDDQDPSLDEVEQPPGSPANEDRDLGLQYFLKATTVNNIRGEVGLRFNGVQPNPYAGARWRHTFGLGSWESSAYQRFRWYLEEHWESITTVDFERLLSEDVFFRSTTSGSYYEQEPGYFYGQYFSIFHWIDGEGLFTYEWNNYFRTRPEDVLDETQLRVRFARRVLKDWILLEIAPQVSWRENIDYEPAFGVLFRFEFFFGGSMIQYHSPLHRPLDDPEYDDDRYLDGNR